MVHCVWGTKRRETVLTKEIRKLVIEHLKENAKKKGIFIDTLDGHVDHLHALISMGAKQNIAEIMQLIKGESAFWINNKTTLINQKFEWADEYFAVSVSESQLDNVRNYINNQEHHHMKVTFQQEYDEFIKKYEFPMLG
jgi:REP element-mobilizing transposase RayT